MRSEPLYRYRGFFFANLAAVSIGCARRMLDDLRGLMDTKVLMPEGVPMKDDGRALLVLGESTAALQAAAAYQDDALGSIWETVVAGDDPSADQRATLLMMLVHGVQTGQRIAEAVTEVIGAQSIYRTSPFERRRRDLTTVAAHVLGQRKTLTSRRGSSWVTSRSSRSPDRGRTRRRRRDRADPASPARRRRRPPRRSTRPTPSSCCSGSPATWATGRRART